MARTLFDNYDLSQGAASVIVPVMQSSANQIITFIGTGLDADDATLSWKLNNEDEGDFLPVVDDNGDEVTKTLVTTAGNVSGYFNHSSFPASFMELTITPNSVTTGTFSAVLGGRVRVQR